jgi:hypothetical protein
VGGAVTSNQLEELLRPAAIEELRQIFVQVAPEDMTSTELLGLVAILRPAMERFNTTKAAPAQPVKLSVIREAKSGRATR